jgi:hypothetical protein
MNIYFREPVAEQLEGLDPKSSAELLPALESMNAAPSVSHLTRIRGVKSIDPYLYAFRTGQWTIVFSVVDAADSPAIAVLDVQGKESRRRWWI